jgi:hypothetical protein
MRGRSAGPASPAASWPEAPGRSRSTPDGLDDEEVGEPRDHRLAAGPKLAGLGRDQLEGAAHPTGSGAVGAVDVDGGGQDRHEVACGWMIEPHGAADQRRGGAAATVVDHLVAVAEVLELELEDRRSVGAGLAEQPVPLAVRNERQVAGMQPHDVVVAHLDEHASGNEDVEPQVSRHRVKGHAPGRGELGPGVERAGHRSECSASPSGSGGGHELAFPVSRSAPQFWTVEHGSATNGHGRALAHR